MAVTTIIPGWELGWHKILKDDDVHQILSWFLHYARQYIHRSYMANMLMTVWERQKRVLHPFGSSAIHQYYGPAKSMPSIEQAFDTAKQMATAEWGSASDAFESTPIHAPWATRNTLDPFVHQAVFHFLRAQNLKSEEFGPEAVVAFDCMMHTIGSFIRTRCGLANEPTRNEICVRLGISVDFVELSEYMYFLRNNFGAHAGGWRWWDQAELMSEDVLAEIGGFAEQVLAAAADLEPQFRVVEPRPAK